jgi:glycerol-3-phosphate dehydrogenase
MGLPKSKLSATRKQVESGTLSSRHDQPNDELESDSRLGKGNPGLKEGAAAEK